MNYVKSVMHALVCVLILFVLLSLRERNRYEAQRFKWEQERFRFEQERHGAWVIDRIELEKFRAAQKAAAEARKAAEEEKKAALHKRRQAKGAK